jgi:hypothetical protein
MVGRINGTAVVGAGLLALFLGGFAVPSHAATAAVIHGTAIVEQCADHHWWDYQWTCHGRFDPDGDTPVIEYVTITTRHKYHEGDMLNASVTDLNAREARLDGKLGRSPSSWLLLLIGGPVVAAILFGINRWINRGRPPRA